MTIESSFERVNRETFRDNFPRKIILDQSATSNEPSFCFVYFFLIIFSSLSLFCFKLFNVNFLIMQLMSSCVPMQSPGTSPLTPASVTLSVGTSKQSPMSQTPIHSSQTQRSQHKCLSRFHTNILQFCIQVVLPHQCSVYKTM